MENVGVQLFSTFGERIPAIRGLPGLWMDEDKPSGLDNLCGHPPSRALERLVTGAGDIVMYFDD
jgi:hypothetical protein